jgi:predicted nicotinamide N-methyase
MRGGNRGANRGANRGGASRSAKARNGGNAHCRSGRGAALCGQPSPRRGTPRAAGQPAAIHTSFPAESSSFHAHIPGLSTDRRAASARLAGRHRNAAVALQVGTRRQGTQAGAARGRHQQPAGGDAAVRRPMSAAGQPPPPPHPAGTGTGTGTDTGTDIDADADADADAAAARAGDFVRAHTVRGHAPLVPEIALHLAGEITPIWQATEAWLAERNVDPPFWAFAWPGGQALARHVLDHPETVAGRRVLDFAAGGGIAAIACARAGAACVEAAEIDRLAIAAIRLNAAANGVAIQAATGDVVGAACRWDLILCGDVCYEAPMTAHILPWLRRMASEAEIWLADPGRAYLPRDGLIAFARTRVATTLELEDRTEREVVLYRLSG